MSDLKEQDSPLASKVSPERAQAFAIVSILIFVIGAIIFFTKFSDILNTSEVDPREVPYRNQSIEWKMCGDDVLLAEDSQSEDFNAKAAQCGTFEVPANYATELGSDLPDLNIIVLKSPALDQENKFGTLFFNPGGPGGSGIQMVQWLSIPDEIRTHYDIVGFDPRGVGKSSPIKCDDKAFIDTYFETSSSPKTEYEAQKSVEWQNKIVADCAEANPNWWVMTSLNTVRDMDIMREIITGDEKFNYVGMSYGTTLGIEYIRAFPDKAGRIVLDSLTSNDTDSYYSAGDSSTYESLLPLFEACAQDIDCPGTTATEVEDLIIVARDKARLGNLEGMAKHLSSQDIQDDEYVATTDQLIYDGLVALTYWSTEDAYPSFKQSMIDFQNGTVGNLEYYGLGLYGWDFSGDQIVRDNSYEMLNIVNCLDIDSRDLRTEIEANTDEVASKLADPFTYRYFDTDQIVTAQDATPGCDWSWLAFDDLTISDPPKVMERPVNESGQKFLIIGSSLDAATPLENSQIAAIQLGSRLITYEGSGHAPSFQGITCIDDAVVSYLIEGFLPEKDIFCPAN
jgi:pimeloyl-ACP methyl ester carboxylesterase